MQKFYKFVTKKTEEHLFSIGFKLFEIRVIEKNLRVDIVIGGEDYYFEIDLGQIYFPVLEVIEMKLKEEIDFCINNLV